MIKANDIKECLERDLKLKETEGLSSTIEVNDTIFHIRCVQPNSDICVDNEHNYKYYIYSYNNTMDEVRNAEFYAFKAVDYYYIDLLNDGKRRRKIGSINEGYICEFTKLNYEELVNELKKFIN